VQIDSTEEVEQTMAAGDAMAYAEIYNITADLNTIAEDYQVATLLQVSGEVGVIANTLIATCIYRYLASFGWVVLIGATTGAYPVLGRGTASVDSLIGALNLAMNDEFSFSILGNLGIQSRTSVVNAGVMENAHLLKGSFSYKPPKDAVDLFRSSEQKSHSEPDFRIYAFVGVPGGLPVGGAETVNFHGRVSLRYQVQLKRPDLW
jgi:hypothetical protein